MLLTADANEPHNLWKRRVCERAPNGAKIEIKKNKNKIMITDSKGMVNGSFGKLDYRAKIKLENES